MLQDIDNFDEIDEQLIDDVQDLQRSLMNKNALKKNKDLKKG